MVTLTGTFTRLDGDPATGTVKITPSRSPILDSTGKVIISGPQVFPLDKDGKLTTEIPASNDPDLGPAFTYTVEALLSHKPWKISKVWIPHGPSTIDISTIAGYTPLPGVATRVVTIPDGGDEGESLVWRDHAPGWERLLTDADADTLAGYALDAETARDDIAGMIAHLPTMENIQGMFTRVLPKWVNMTRPAYIIPGWDVPVSVTLEPDGTFTADIDHESLHRRTPGKIMYVDPVNGSRNNDGLTWATAKDTPGRAARDSNNYGTSEVIIRGGVWTRADVSGIDAAGRPDIIIRAEPGTRPIFTQGDSMTTWTHHEGNAHKVVTSNTGIIIDRSIINPNGYPEVLTVVDSLAELAATPGSAYKPGAAEAHGSEVYVHLSDGRVPDADVLVGRPTYHLDTSGIDRTEPFSYLFEGIEFWGGDYTLLRSTVPDETFIAKNCAWRWAHGNGLSVVGFARTILINCEATDNGNDGFNYHADSSGTLTGQVLEIGCTYARNGRLPGSSQNGSTAHEDYKIVRVNCLAHHNPGPQFADVNYAQSLNYGCDARDIIGYEGVPDWDFTAPELGGKLVLIGGSSTGPKAIREATNAEVFGFSYVGATGGTPKQYLS